MSEMASNPGDWQASDGLWYSAAQHPDPAYRAQFEAPPAAAAPQAAAPPVPDAPAYAPQAAAPAYAPQAYAPQAAAPHGWIVGTEPYPARMAVSDDTKVARWRPFLHMFMAIPHFFVLLALAIANSFVMMITWFVVLFTGKMPAGLHNFQAMNLRYSGRVSLFTGLFTEAYPPFDFTTTAQDPGTYAPARFDFDHEPEGRNRLTVFFRYFMLIPHMFVLFFVIIAAYFVTIAATIAVIILGRMPEGMRNFLLGVHRWALRLNAYFSMLTDSYPPFSTG